MRLRDLVDELEIPLAKFTNYALNPQNERGQHKARVFASALGYTQENYGKLLAQIRQHALDAEVTLGRHDQHGLHLHIDLAVAGVTGQRAVIRVGWLLAVPDQRQARLVTLYVRKEEK